MPAEAMLAVAPQVQDSAELPRLLNRCHNLSLNSPSPRFSNLNHLSSLSLNHNSRHLSPNNSRSVSVSLLYGNGSNTTRG